MLLLTFTIDGNRHAIEASRVTELVPRVPLRPAPLAPPFLAGLLAYRGRVVPIIDMGMLLGKQRCRDQLATRIILVDCGTSAGSGSVASLHQASSPSGMIGMIVEEANDLLDVQSQDISPAPMNLPHAPYLGQMIQKDRGSIVQLILADHLGGVLVGAGAELEYGRPARGESES